MIIDQHLKQRSRSYYEDPRRQVRSPRYQVKKSPNENTQRNQAQSTLECTTEALHWTAKNAPELPGEAIVQGKDIDHAPKLFVVPPVL